jgi:hypothetical protein
MGLAAVARHKLGGFVPVGSIFHASARIGEFLAARRNDEPSEAQLPKASESPVVLAGKK